MYFLLLISLLITSLNEANAEQSQDWVYVVSDGDSLWNISRKYLTDVKYYDSLQRINQIKHPKKMRPGTLAQKVPWGSHVPHSSRG